MEEVGSYAHAGVADVHGLIVCKGQRLAQTTWSFVVRILMEIVLW